MMQALRHLRDFLSEEQLKWLPGNIRVESCILLQQHKKGGDGITRGVLQVFDAKGIYIGEISNPDYVPQ
jgi:hypothetical protein